MPCDSPKKSTSPATITMAASRTMVNPYFFTNDSFAMMTVVVNDGLVALRDVLRCGLHSYPPVCKTMESFTSLR